TDNKGEFCLLTLSGQALGEASLYAFYLYSPADITDKDKIFSLSSEEIRLINPNTLTAPIFKQNRDAEITKGIYRQIPVLFDENQDAGNPWGVTFSTMFHMTNDADKFQSYEELQQKGCALQGNIFTLDSTAYLPLYEARMIHQYTHRWASNNIDGVIGDFRKDQLNNPFAVAMPRYWVNESYVSERLDDTQYMIGFRDISRTSDEHTLIATLFPRSAVSNKLPMLFVNPSSDSNQYDRFLHKSTSLMQCAFLANLIAFVVDFVVRQKVSGASLNFYLVKQFPVIPPYTYMPSYLDFIAPRALELIYTAWDLRPFAQDVGYHGAPFIWDEERRFLMRCELDALYFHLYQIQRDDVDYIMETFPIVKRKDIARTSDENGEGGEYVTKRIILEMYDQMAALPSMHVPAPKDESATYAVPDVSQWQTWLNPPPADPSVAHGE
ncbi:MAG: SAM-dependent DNA methyltransferase, partial [Anaerolineae bacterium]|nr:SAM-dependent DNA methyltransferase [Anaerolineae bacterium]